jgi:hypothetical protein
MFVTGLGLAAPATAQRAALSAGAVVSHGQLLEIVAASPAHPHCTHALAPRSHQRPHRGRARGWRHTPIAGSGRVSPWNAARQSAATPLAPSPQGSGFQFALMSGAALEAALARLRR